jgi:hypothetical protein
MSATPTRSLEGTHAPSPFELLWERYRSLILTIIAAAFAALLIHYGVRYYNQTQVDKTWTSFAVSIGIDDIYTDPEQAQDSLAEELKDQDLATLEQAHASASPEQKPFLLLAIARRAMMDENWDRAASALTDLEKGYPKHSLVRVSDNPVQSREMVKDEEEPTQPNARKKPEWKPAKEGSVVSLMREQIAAARSFALPGRFAKPEIPADAPRIRFVLGDYGSFVIALMPQAPLHKEAVLKLAKAEGPKFWEGIAIELENWRLIAAARSAQGDRAGAEQARERVAELQDRIGD